MQHFHHRHYITEASYPSGK